MGRKNPSWSPKSENVDTPMEDDREGIDRNFCRGS
jgi:hypothetical protein